MSDYAVIDSDRATSLLLICVGLGYFIALLDITLINVALPLISSGFRLDASRLSMVANTYTWALIIGLPVGGRLGDQFGRRRLFILAVSGLALFGVFGGCASTLTMLLISRIGLGICAGLMLPQTLTLIRAGFPSEKQGWALGVWGAIGGVASIAGPLVGGALVTWFGWRAIFLLNVPVALIVVISTLYWVRVDPKPSSTQGINLVGMVLLSALMAVVGLGLLLLGGGELTIGSALCLAGIWLLIRLVRHEKDVSSNMAVLPKSLSLNSEFVCLCGVGAVVSAGVFAITFVISTFSQDIAGVSAFAAGMCVFPASLVSIIVSPRAGHAVDHGFGRASVILGLLCVIVAFLLLQWAVVESDIWVVAVAAAIFGAGNGLLIPTLTALALRIAKDDVVGAASAIVILTRQFGALLGGIAATATLRVQGVSLQNITGADLARALILLVCITIGGLLWFAFAGPTAEVRQVDLPD